MKNKKYFNLYSCCIPVKGYKRSIIYDIQRDSFDFIPNVLYEILISLVKKRKSVGEIKVYFSNQQDELISEYFSFLENKEYGFFSDKYLLLPNINVKQYNEPKKITNSIIDFAPESSHTLDQIIPELTECMCEALEIRYFFGFPYQLLLEKLVATNNSSIRDIEVLIEYNKTYTLKNIIKIRNRFARLRKLTLYNSPYNRIFEHEEITIIFTKSIIDSEIFCGVINPWYFISKTELFIEAKSYNSCLNKKISIDKHGNIKNCPSMTVSYGNISNTRLSEIIENEEFKTLWKIKKDDIEICKDCEFRYMCQDCRAYIVDESNIYSKPSKCKYNPHE